MQRAVVSLLALVVVVPVYIGSALPASASSSCTGWNSITTPPSYIRVGRSDGSVDTVTFRKYVGTVTAMEWPYWLPRSAREVGAIAVKQYGWYFTLAGHHRDGFVNSNGKCYDVVDSTRDQLYKPEKVTVRRAIWSVVDGTWDVTLRKNGTFFMTGYRYGADVRCGSDADGSRFYERSVVDCAHRGLSSHQIILKYISAVTFFSGATKVAAAITPAPTPAPTPQPTPQPTPKPTAATPSPAPDPTPFVDPNRSPTIGGELIDPLALDAATGDLDGVVPPPDDSLSSPGFVWLPQADRDSWTLLCLTSVGPYPAGRYSVLAQLPPPFGCAVPAEAGAPPTSGGPAPAGALPAQPAIADAGVVLLN